MSASPTWNVDIDDVGLPTRVWSNQRKRDDTYTIYKLVPEIDSGLTDSTLSFRLLFSSVSNLSSLLPAIPVFWYEVA